MNFKEGDVFYASYFSDLVDKFVVIKGKVLKVKENEVVYDEEMFVFKYKGKIELVKKYPKKRKKYKLKTLKKLFSTWKMVSKTNDIEEHFENYERYLEDWLEDVKESIKIVKKIKKVAKEMVG